MVIGVGVDELGGEPPDPEVLARGVREAAGVADHDLDAAAAEVEAQRRRGLEQHARPHGPEDELGLAVAADDLDRHARLGLDAVDDVVAVGGAADRAGRAGQGLGRAGGFGEQAEPPHGVDRGVGGGLGDAAPPADDVAEAEHLLLPHQRLEVPVRVDLGDEQVERVRPQVEGGDPHGPSVERRSTGPG